MIELIIITVLMVYFVNALLTKFDVYKKFEDYGMKTKFKFIHRLSKCEFCINFHLGWILFVLVMFCEYLDTIYILIPFCVSGCLKLIKK